MRKNEHRHFGRPRHALRRLPPPPSHSRDTPASIVSATLAAAPATRAVRASSSRTRQSVPPAARAAPSMSVCVCVWKEGGEEVSRPVRGGGAKMNGARFAKSRPQALPLPLSYPTHQQALARDRLHVFRHGGPKTQEGGRERNGRAKRAQLCFFTLRWLHSLWHAPPRRREISPARHTHQVRPSCVCVCACAPRARKGREVERRPCARCCDAGPDCRLPSSAPAPAPPATFALDIDGT